MYSANVIGPRSRIRSARNAPSGVTSGRAPESILPLGSARKHLDDVVVEAIVKLLLKGPGELRLLDFAWLKPKRIAVHFRLSQLESNLYFDRFGCRLHFE